MATFQKRGSRWRAIVRKTGYPAQSKSFPTKAQAQAWAKSIESQIDSGELTEVEILRSVTIGHVCDVHLRHLSRTSARGRRFLSDDKQIRASLGEMTTLHALNYQTLAVFCRTRLELDGVKPSTTMANIMYLSGALSTGVLELNLPARIRTDMAGWIKGLSRAGLIASPSKRDRRPTREELSLILTHVRHNKALRDIDYAALIRFAVASCMRLSEITELRWDDIDLESGVVVIRNRKHPTGKAGNDQRVPLMGDAASIIAEQPVVTARAFPFHSESVSNGFRRICRSLGIHDLRFHDLRHEGISRLFERGYAIQEVSMVSGHRDWGSLKRYVNLRPEELARRDKGE